MVCIYKETTEETLFERRGVRYASEKNLKMDTNGICRTELNAKLHVYLSEQKKLTGV